jgi:hypothetical protein
MFMALKGLRRIVDYAQAAVMAVPFVFGGCNSCDSPPDHSEKLGATLSGAAQEMNSVRQSISDCNVLKLNERYRVGYAINCNGTEHKVFKKLDWNGAGVTLGFENDNSDRVDVDLVGNPDMRVPIVPQVLGLRLGKAHCNIRQLSRYFNRQAQLYLDSNPVNPMPADEYDQYVANNFGCSGLDPKNPLADVDVAKPQSLAQFVKNHSALMRSAEGRAESEK